MMRKLAKADAALCQIIVLAVAVRCWGIRFGLPYLDARPDETTVMNVAATFLTGDLNPHFFIYPTLYSYCLFGLYLSYGLASGRLLSFAELAREYLADPMRFFLLDRGLSIFTGVATVLVVYKVAARLADRRTALAAALFLALCPLHVRDSHFGVTDVAAVLPVMGSVLFILRASDDPRPSNYLLAGICAGLATSIKYIGVVLALPIAIAHWSITSGTTGRSLRTFLDRRMALFVGGLSLAFLLTTPFLVVDFGKFVDDMVAEARYVSVSHRMDLGRGWWYHLRYSLPLGLGPPLFLASVAGIAVLMKRDFRRAAVFFSFPLFYYVVTGSGRSVYLRYTLPLLPFLCVAGAVFWIAASDALAGHIRLQQRAVALLLIGLVVLPSALRVVRSDQLLATEDSRLLAVEWMTRNLPPGSSVYLSGRIWREHRFFPWLHRLQNKYGIPDGDMRLTDGADPHSTWAVLSSYSRWTYDAAAKHFRSGDRIEEGLPSYIVVRQSPLLGPDEPPRAVTEAVKASYRLARSFQAYDPGRDDYWFDQQDGFFLPFAGTAGVQRPGPNISVYERVR